MHYTYLSTCFIIIETGWTVCFVWKIPWWTTLPQKKTNPVRNWIVLLTISALAHSAFPAQSVQLCVSVLQQPMIPTRRLQRFWTLGTGHIGNNDSWVLKITESQWRDQDRDCKCLWISMSRQRMKLKRCESQWRDRNWNVWVSLPEMRLKKSEFQWRDRNWKNVSLNDKTGQKMSIPRLQIFGSKEIWSEKNVVYKN